ncbi:MAG: citrate synthase, partial [Nitrospirae bacterium]|nr:citrate synthase [Fimbriimonadaceae bacterium]
MSATTEYPNYSPGLEGVIAGITTISEIDSDRSSLTYRGIDVHQLAEFGSYEETTYLLLFGKLPNRAELDAFNATLSAERAVPSEVYTAIAQLPKTTHPMDMLKVGFAALAPFDPDYAANDRDANLRKAVRMVAKAGVLTANGYRILQGKEPVQPKPGLGTAATFLYCLLGEDPDPYTTKVMDASLTLYAEHGFNA